MNSELTESDKLIPQQYLVQTLIDYCKALHQKGKLDQLRRMDNLLREIDQNISPETFGEWNSKAYDLINVLYDEDKQVQETELHPQISASWSKTRVEDIPTPQLHVVSTDNQDAQEACIEDSQHHRTD
jgi:hypothetical protein